MRSDPARQVPGEGVNAGFPPASSTMAWFARRKWPLLVAALFFITGIAFTFWWCPVVDHLHQWIDSEDLWDTYRAAQWVGWGNEGAVYQHGIYSIVFPGIDVVLAPVAIVSTHYRLIDPYPYFIRYPSALPLLMPYVLAISVPALLVFDYLAEFLDVVPRRRILLCWMQGALLWPLVVMWGHPEEAIALAFIVLSMVSAFSERWTRAGWYLGFGVAFQPYALLLLPILLGLAPKGTRWATIVRTSLISCALLVLPIIQGFHATVHAVFVQPTYLHPNHGTPLLALAPHLSGNVYSAGVSRYFVLLCALLAGWWTWTHQPGPRETIWLGALVLAVRCVVEPVMAPYYVWACAAFLMTVSAGQRSLRFMITSGALAFASLWAYQFTSEWAYWAPIVVALAIAVAMSRPAVTTTTTPDVPIARPLVGAIQ